jgi:hypothetical protein
MFVIAVTAMENLALSYLALEKHDVALLTQQRVLQYRKETLHDNHPEIGTSTIQFFHAIAVNFTRSMVYKCAGTAMAKLAKILHALGRHKDALEMQKEALEFMRRVLPENHPDIGEKAMLGA